MQYYRLSHGLSAISLPGCSSAPALRDRSSCCSHSSSVTVTVNTEPRPFSLSTSIVPFIISLLITAGAGMGLVRLGHDAPTMMTRRDSYAVVTLTWLAFSVFGSLPYMLSGIIINPTNAFFETMSGFTTTGASILDDVEQQLDSHHAILFWRSLSQWIGGLGIVFFTIAVLPSMVSGSTRVFSAEATGPIRTKMHPRLSTNAKWIWSVYLALTLGCAICYFVAGMDWFSAINYSMTTTACNK